MARPSLADSLRASLSKGVHVDTAEKIARGLAPIPDDEPPSPTLLVQSVSVLKPVIEPVVLADTRPVVISAPVIPGVIVTIQKPIVEPAFIQADEQASKQAIKQPSNQTTKQTITSTGGQTNKQTNIEANEQTNNQTSSKATKQSIRQPYQQDSKHSDEQSGNQTTEQSIEQIVQRSTEQSLQQSVRQPAEQSFKQSPRHAWLPLNENQGRILLYLYESGNGLTNMDIVCAETGIAYGTARTSIDILMKEGYVTNKLRHNGHAFRGFEYALNNHLCSLYISRIKGEQSAEQSSWQMIRQPSKQTTGQSINQTVGSFSSKFLKEDLNLTTNPSCLDDPELGYWKEKGVTQRQIEKWTEDFAMETDLVLQSLKHCRYEMVVLNHEEEKKIENPVNWFFRVMQRTGLYPRPADYKSIAEIRAEVMERAAKDMADARIRQITAEKELAFQKILSDPDGNGYQKLYDQVSAFAKEEGGEALIFALRDVFFGH